MNYTWKKKAKGVISRTYFCMFLLFISFMCLQFLFSFSLPKLVSLDNISISKQSHREIPELCRGLEKEGFGEFGDMMLAMLPDDLPFTLFAPSNVAFENVLRLEAKENLSNAYAVVSRVLGFSAVPQHLSAKAVPLREALLLDSVSGFLLHVWRDDHGSIVVNGVSSECVDLRKGEIIVHVMGGVIMDAEFEQSFSSDYEE